MVHDFSACQRQQQCNSVEIITLLTISVIDSGPSRPTRAPCWIWYLQVHHFFYDPLRGMPAFQLKQLSVLGILTINVSVSLTFITEAACPEWSELENAMAAVHSVVHGLVKFSKVSASLI